MFTLNEICIQKWPFLKGWQISYKRQMTKEEIYSIFLIFNDFTVKNESLFLQIVHFNIQNDESLHNFCRCFFILWQNK